MSRHFPGVRGSPLVRFFILVLGLAATGAGLLRLTSAKADDHPSPARPAGENAPLAAVPYRLLLSAPAASVKIDTGLENSTQSVLSGRLEMDPANPRVGLTVHWQSPAAVGEHRFAKLTLEAPGQETFTHVFDADGDIDDLVELPLK